MVHHFNLKVRNIFNKQRFTGILLLVALCLLVSARGWGQALDAVATANPGTVCAERPVAGAD